MERIAVLGMTAVVILIGVSLLLLFTKWRYGKAVSGFLLLTVAVGMLCALLVFRERLEEIWSFAQYIILTSLCVPAIAGGIAVIAGAFKCLQPKDGQAADEKEPEGKNQGDTV